MIIYKYPVNLYATSIEIPKHSKLLKVAMQHGEPTFWFEHTEQTRGDLAMNLRIHIIDTGQSFDHPATFVYYDTIFDPNGYVWHVYVDNWILDTTHDL